MKTLALWLIFIFLLFQSISKDGREQRFDYYLKYEIRGQILKEIEKTILTHRHQPDGAVHFGEECIKRCIPKKEETLSEKVHRGLESGELIDYKKILQQ